MKAISSLDESQDASSRTIALLKQRAFTAAGRAAQGNLSAGALIWRYGEMRPQISLTYHFWSSKFTTYDRTRNDLRKELSWIALRSLREKLSYGHNVELTSLRTEITPPITTASKPCNSVAIGPPIIDFYMELEAPLNLYLQVILHGE